MLTPDMISKFNEVTGNNVSSVSNAGPSRADQIRALAKPATPQTEQTQNDKSGILEFGKGVIKGAGRSAVNLLEGASKTIQPTVLGVGPFGIGGTPTAPKSFEASNPSQKAGGYAETAAEIAIPALAETGVAGESLIQKAQRLYQSALKPTGSPEEKLSVVKTGLKEGIRLTQGGIQKAASVIDSMEEQLGKAIDAAGGKTIRTASLQGYLNEVKQFFANTADVKGAEADVAKLDSMMSEFGKKYGEEIPTKVAQEIKVNTYRQIKKFYEKLSAPAIEGSKAIARGLKEGIVKVAPQVDDINARLGKLYEFETALDRAKGRIGNTDIISMSSKLMGTLGGAPGRALALANQVFGGTAIKSMGAIGMDRIGTLLQKLAPEELETLRKLWTVSGGKLANKASTKVQEAITQTGKGR